MFQENLKKKIQGCFKNVFNEVLFDKFFVGWISLQLPEQNEGLFLLLLGEFGRREIIGYVD